MTRPILTGEAEGIFDVETGCLAVAVADLGVSGCRALVPGGSALYILSAGSASTFVCVILRSASGSCRESPTVSLVTR